MNIQNTAVYSPATSHSEPIKTPHSPLIESVGTQVLKNSFKDPNCATPINASNTPVTPSLLKGINNCLINSPILPENRNHTLIQTPPFNWKAYYETSSYFYCEESPELLCEEDYVKSLHLLPFSTPELTRINNMATKFTDTPKDLREMTQAEEGTPVHEQKKQKTSNNSEDIINYNLSSLLTEDSIYLKNEKQP